MTTQDGLKAVLHEIRNGSLRDEWAAWLMLADWLDEEPDAVAHGEGLMGSPDQSATQGRLAEMIRDEILAEQERTRIAGGVRQSSKLSITLDIRGEGVQGFHIDGTHVRWRL